jgi:cyclopropane-fatty-acyl-phospholipid synthase
MANRQEIEKHYDTLGALHALRMEGVQEGFPDYTCAFYDGNFRKSYVQAQADKHAWILNGLHLGQDLRDKRLLDIGCGWGPMLNAIQLRGGSAVGMTLSSGQVRYGHEHGVDIRLLDYKQARTDGLGVFDGIVSIGSFEHFCSTADLRAGLQDDVYRNFFRICAEMLPAKGRLYLQTMTWGKSVPNIDTLSLHAPKDSMEAILARILYLYPGSWLPNGLQHIINCASGYFNFVSSNNGRLDYLQTLKDWDRTTDNLWRWRMLPRTLRIAIPLVFNILTKREVWIQYESVRRSDQNTCFEREIMSHERILFEKK